MRLFNFSPQRREHPQFQLKSGGAEIRRSCNFSEPLKRRSHVPGLKEAGLLPGTPSSVIIHPSVDFFVRDASEADLQSLHYESLLSSGQIKLVLGEKHPVFIVLWKEAVDIWSCRFQHAKILSKNSGNYACLVLIPEWSHLSLIHCYTKTFRVNSANLWKFKEGNFFFFFFK